MRPGGQIPIQDNITSGEIQQKTKLGSDPQAVAGNTSNSVGSFVFTGLLPVFGEYGANFFHCCELTLISLMQTSQNIDNLPLLQLVMQLRSEMSIKDFFNSWVCR
jgi:hypothetical protein